MSKNDPIDLAKVDQESAFLGDFLTKLWYRMFVNLTEHGFTPDQALELVKTYIMSQGTK